MNEWLTGWLAWRAFWQAAISKRLMDPAVIAVNFQFLIDLAVLLAFATVVAIVCEALQLPAVFSQVSVVPGCGV